MAVGHVRADDEEQVGAVEVGVGTRRAVGAERLLVSGSGAGHAQPRVRLDVHGAQETLGQFGGQILCLDGHLAGDVERDGVRSVLVDDGAQPPARLGNGVVDGRGHQFVVARRPQQRRRQPAVVAAIISACVAPFVHNRPKLVGCSLSPETRAMTGPAGVGVGRGLHLDAAADAAVRARRTGHRHEPMVGGQCFGLFPIDVIAMKIDAHRVECAR